MYVIDLVISFGTKTATTLNNYKLSGNSAAPFFQIGFSAKKTKNKKN